MLAIQRCFLIVAAGVLLAMAGCSDLGNPIKPEPRPELSTTSLDFGIVAVNGSATRSLTVRNTGSAVLTGTAAVSCAGYGLLSGGGAFSLAPGESREILVRFAPTAVGSFPCTLDLGPGAPPVPISGAGAEQAPGALCLVAPDSIDFGIAPVGQVKSGAFRIFSVGAAPLLVSVVSTSPDYSVVSGGGIAEIPVGDSLDVLVEFRPQGGKDRPGAISVGPGCPEVTLKGFGTTVSYQNDIRAVFDLRCDQSCHTHVFKNPETAYSNLINFGYIVPFDLANSSLYFRIVTGNMPQGGPPLSQAELDLFRDWILEGATDN